MTILKTLTLAAASPARATTPEQRLRVRLLDHLADQRALAAAEIAGTPFNPTRKVTRTDDAGNKVRVDAPRQVRKGWFTDATGKLFFQVRYAGKPLDLAKGMNAVAVADTGALPEMIGTIIDAVNAGELDPQLTAASAERKANFKPRAKKAG
ncbi:hypothetical protein [Sphingomonas hengshuiensis]|uniref:Uncharacterized protein n=1 Tax=Sphingomonas hengshuiensis TaxID=1609977 RepID=A0A7U5BF91_9SPHN|nr:hypothetical protein [Sphingomonas hengshuiensis]AJP74173.1 hypothetical protein TS85_00995 [Sphingomonas hengshuiensis]